MKFENTKVMNFEGALRGMRNPKNSWSKSDSFFGITGEYDEFDYEVAHSYLQKFHPTVDFSDYNYGIYSGEFDEIDAWLIKNGILKRSDTTDSMEAAFIGPNDMRLAQTLIKAGPEHRKFMRQILVSVDITAPMYFFFEFDTYKIGTVANSTSKMHKLVSTPITIDCFETDDINNVIIEDSDDPTMIITSKNTFLSFINWLEKLRERYNEIKDIRYWKELIRLLPESWLQTRTITMNYENLLSMVKQRKSHKLTEWSNSFISWVKTLPYAQELIFINEINPDEIPYIDLSNNF